MGEGKYIKWQLMQIKRTKRHKIIEAAFVIIGFLFFITLFSIKIFHCFKMKSEMEKGNMIESVGFIYDKSFHRGGKAIMFKFKLKDENKWINSSMKVNGDVYDFNIGDEYQVLYLPSNPQRYNLIIVYPNCKKWFSCYCPI